MKWRKRPEDGVDVPAVGADGPRSVRAGRDAHLIITGDGNSVVFRGEGTGADRLRVPRSSYELEVRALEAAEFRGREAELEAMARFAAAATPSAGDYWRWLAPAWSGKTSLMARFYLNPPEQVDVVGFFITSRMAGRADRTAFLSALQSQLRAYLRDPRVECTGYGDFLGALQDAGAHAVAAGRRLVLLVDGLDEDTGVTSASSGHSIAALLPLSVPDGLRIVVAGRPNPPVPGDLPDHHPLRKKVINHSLTEFSEARAIRADAERNLRTIIDAGGSGRDFVGLIAASGGGLGIRDLAHLTGLTGRRVEIELGGAAGRVFQHRSAQYERDSEGRPAKLYAFAHQELLTGARDLLPRADLEGYRGQVHDYVDRARQARWPSTTTEFALLSYPRMLREQRDRARLTDLATDLPRQERLWGVTGTDVESLTEITDAFALHREESELDLRACVRLAHCRTRLRKKAAGTPVEVVQAWAERGYGAKATALIGLMRHRLGLEEVYESILRTSPPLQAVDSLMAACRGWESSSEREEEQDMRTVQRACVARLVDSGLYEEALARVRSISSDPLEQVELLGSATGVPVEALQVEEIGGLAERAALLARDETDTDSRDFTLSCVVRLLVNVGRIDEAVEMARSLVSPFRLKFSLDVVAEALIDAGRADEVAGLAEGVSDPLHHLVIGSVAVPLARIGRVDEAARLARSVVDPSDEVLLLHQIVAVSNTADRAEETIALLDRAERLARGLSDGEERATALARVTDALVKGGRCERALEVARSITVGKKYGEALSRAARALAEGGWDRESVELARAITDESERDDALASIAGAWVVKGRTEEAVALVRTITERAKRASVLGSLALTLTREGRIPEADTCLDEATTLTRAVVDVEEWESALSRVALALARAGRAREALELARTITDSTEHGYDLGQIAEACVERLEECLELVRGIADPKWQDYGIGSIAKALAKADRVGEAVGAARTITNSKRRSYALRRIAGELTEADRIDEAVELAQEIDDPGELAFALTPAAEALLSKGMRKEAGAILDQALQAVWDLPSEANSLNRIAKVLDGAGRSKKAGAVLSRAEKLAQRISKSGKRTLQLQWVAGAWAYTGRTEKALELARRTAGPKERDEAISSIVQALAETGRVEEAVRLHRTVATSRRWLALESIIVALIAEEKLEQAVRLVQDNPPSISSWGVERLAAALAVKGRTGEAVSLEKAVSSPFDGRWIREEVIEALIKTDRVEEALELARAIARPEQRAIALGSVAKAWGATSAGRKMLGEALSDGNVDDLVEPSLAVAPEVVGEILHCLHHMAP